MPARADARSMRGSSHRGVAPLARGAGAALRGRGIARRFLAILLWCRFTGNHRLSGFVSQQLALLVAVLVAPF
jgi:hypothetical protein